MDISISSSASTALHNIRGVLHLEDRYIIIDVKGYGMAEKQWYKKYLLFSNVSII